MATFGATGCMKQKCLNAVEEASKILNSVADMNAWLKIDLNEEMLLGSGMHAGETIVGMMSHGKTVS